MTSTGFPPMVCHIRVKGDGFCPHPAAMQAVMDGLGGTTMTINVCEHHASGAGIKLLHGKAGARTSARLEIVGLVCHMRVKKANRFCRYPATMQAVISGVGWTTMTINVCDFHAGVYGYAG